MPRPGPRSYECVRRAWHSDRHQPMRSSLVQEIFRVVNEIHTSPTKKNKEWQEKLPIVVLKADEIIYSKANSEPEYMDLKTLWDRGNDAINTIIRRDKSTETGELLQPCIEDASNKILRADLSDILENPPGIGCDLSLRLGSLSVPCISIENSWAQEVEDVGSTTFPEESKLSDLTPRMDKEFSFFPKANADGPLENYSNKWSHETENMNVETTMRKRKALSHPSEDRQFCWQTKLTCNYLAGKLSNAASCNNGQVYENFWWDDSDCKKV